MFLDAYLDGFSDELTKIASFNSGALVGGALGLASGGKTLKRRLARGAAGALVGGGLTAAAGGVKNVMGENHRQLAAAQQQPWSPEGYVPSYMQSY